MDVFEKLEIANSIKEHELELVPGVATIKDKAYRQGQVDGLLQAAKDMEELGDFSSSDIGWLRRRAEAIRALR